MAFDFSRGSEWRRWDLHLHTASSYDYGYKGNDSDDVLIKALRTNNISAVAVTDHFLIDEKRIFNLRQLAPEIVFFPGVELRTDKGDTNIHIILIFDSETNLSVIAEDFRVFKRDKAKEYDSDEKIYWDFNDIVEFASSHNALISVHAGKKSNGVDRQITNALEHNQAVKKEYARYVHIFEMGQRGDLDNYRKCVFPYIKQTKPMIICSDNHDARKYETKVPLWIKADVTFEGLKQIVLEPDERVRLQSESPEYDFDKSPFTKIVITEQTRVFDDNPDVLFEPCVLHLNDSLVSIIGGRGAGKSALINYIASGLGQIKDDVPMGVSTETFNVYRKTSLGEEEKKLVFDGTSHVPFVYISQSQVKKLVSNPQEFTRDIRETIGVIDDYGVESDLHVSIDAAINEFYRFVKFLYSNETPPEVKEAQINADIVRYEQFIASITSEANKNALKLYTDSVRRKGKAETFKVELEDFQSKVINCVSDLNRRIDGFNSRASKLPTMPLVDASATILSIRDVWIKRVDEFIQNRDNEIVAVRNQFPGYTGDLSSLLTNVSKYQEQLLILEKQKEELNKYKTGYDEFMCNGMRKIGERIKASLEDYKTRVMNQWNRFKQGNDGLAEERKRLLEGIFHDDDITVRVDITLNLEMMCELLMEKLDKRRYNKSKLQEILGIHTLEEYFTFITQTGDRSLYDSDIEDQLRNQILDVLFRKYYLFITHRLIVESHGRPITRLSYGQQGTIYLKLKIAANLFMETLIYDQPEDDLDNQFITEELVKLFRRIKKYRQVIIVSHNANLVVNADSEQIIVAENRDGHLAYMSGSLESPAINAAVCRILEGGKSAFASREAKYNLKTNQ